MLAFVPLASKQGAYGWYYRLFYDESYAKEWSGFLTGNCYAFDHSKPWFGYYTVSYGYGAAYYVFTKESANSAFSTGSDWRIVFTSYSDLYEGESLSFSSPIYPSDLTFDNSTLSAENDDYAAPALPTGKAMRINLNFRAGAADDADELPAAIYQAAADPTDTSTGWELSYDVVDAVEDGTTTEPDEEVGNTEETDKFLPSILDSIKALPGQIAEKVYDLFALDKGLASEISDTFKKKFGFISTLKQFGSDLFGMTPETEPPVIWVHLEDGESIYGYDYGGTVKALDLAWYQRYKASVDGILGGFLWLCYLWMLFKRAPGIISGLPLSNDEAPRSVDTPNVSSAPRLERGDPNIVYGDGFTFRKKR